jgi:FkbM family methyltransferase
MVVKILKYILSLIPGSTAFKYFYVFYHTYILKYGLLYREWILIKSELKNTRRAIDVGANIGVFSYHFSKKFDVVESFEPQPYITNMLQEYAKNHGDIRIHSLGLSNREGQIKFYVPMSARGRLYTGLASVNDPKGCRKEIDIAVIRLDDLDLKEVDLIKIDVEGHELEVLEGAKYTILRDKPLLFIEIEQRHLLGKDITSILKYICDLGYTGRYLRNGKLHPIEQFSYEKHQEPHLNELYSKQYINNFLFTPVNIRK